MKSLFLTCPFCSAGAEVPHAGDHVPRYRFCAACGGRFIYEPTEGGVRCQDPGEGERCAPERRTREMAVPGED